MTGDWQKASLESGRGVRGDWELDWDCGLAGMREKGSEGSERGGRAQQLSGGGG